jgi:hypothetical protein
VTPKEGVWVRVFVEGVVIVGKLENWRPEEPTP